MKLHTPAVGYRSDQVHVVVRPAATIGNRYVVGLRHGGDLNAFRVSSDIDNVGLNNVHGLVDQKFSVAPLVSFVLTRRNRDSSLSPKIRKEPRVVSINRLLEPFNPIGLNAFGKVQSGGKRK